MGLTELGVGEPIFHDRVVDVKGRHLGILVQATQDDAGDRFSLLFGLVLTTVLLFRLLCHYWLL